MIPIFKWSHAFQPFLYSFQWFLVLPSRKFYIYVSILEYYLDVILALWLYHSKIYSHSNILLQI
nr:MAG TPA: hypothetical protein [Caudoviricetes sp.]